MLHNFFHFFKNRIFFVFLLIFVLELIILSPNYNFPLNDDWTQSLSIYHYNLNHELFYPAWFSAFNYIPIIFGIILSAIFGFSFAMLRCGNLVISFLIVYLFYLFLRYNKISKLNSFLFSFLLWFNPIFFYLSYTFMGDQIAFMFLLASIFLYQMAFDKKSYKYMFLASAISLLGIFTRQFVALLPAMAFLCFFFSHKLNKKKVLLAFIPSLVLLLGIYFIVRHFGFVPNEVSARFVPFGLIPRTIVFNIINYILLLSLFLIPITLSIINLENIKKIISRKNLVLIITLILGFALTVFYKKFQFPTMGNIINLYGLGPSKTIMQGDIVSNLGNLDLFIINLVLVILSIFNIVYLFEYRKKLHEYIKKNSYIFIFLAIYLILILPIMSFDRYLLIIFPFLILLCAVILEGLKFSKKIFIVLLIIQIVFVFIGTRDYFLWNEARWEMARSLSQNVDIRDIEAGYEWNGWYLYRLSEKGVLGKFTPTWAPWYVKQISKNHQMKYIISFSELGGYRVIDKRKTNTLISPIKYIYLNEVDKK